jgi:spore maturation protein CgeB
MRILIAGLFQFDWYEKICADKIEQLGHEVIRFSWRKYFTSIPGKIEAALGWSGPITWQVNNKLVQAIDGNNIDILLVWRGTCINEKTLKLIKQRNPQCTLVSYNNDDPFSPKYSIKSAPLNQQRLWKIFVNSLPAYDLNFVFRHLNVSEVLQVGGKHADVLLPYFIPEFNQPTKLSEVELDRFKCDVVFIGHYEADGRERYLQQLVAGGLDVKLYGGKYWNRQVLGDLVDYFGEIREVYGDEYRQALAGAKMCLCFLSKLNRDTYTTRCFEIPACGKLLLSERTEDLMKMFKEDEEAVFFSSPEELVEKALWLSQHPEDVERIARAGMERVHLDGHSVKDRMKKFVDVLEKNHLESLNRCSK